MALVPMALSSIRDLKPGDTGKVLELKVYRVWASRNPPDTTEKGYRAILLDRHGDAIQANMDADDIHHFRPILIPGQAFQISDFERTPTDKWQRTLENPTSLSFTRPTRIDAIPIESFPNHYFHFTSYNQLPTKVWDPRDKGIKDYPVLTDYIGCYITSGDAGNIENLTKNQSRIRKVEMQNLNRISIELTLWDGLADKFEKQEIEQLERPIIIAVSSCRVSKFLKRDLQLSSTPATYYYINTNIPDLEQYKAAYRVLYEEKEPLCVTRYRLNDSEKEQQKNRIPFQQLFKHKPASYRGVRFTCQETITKLNTSRGWYYTSCCVCINKVTQSDGNYRCKTHGVIPAPNYRNCWNKPHHYNTTSNPGVTEFVMDEVFGITDKPKQIESNPSGSESLPKALPAPTPELKVETTTEAATHDDSSKETTPPQATSMAMQTRSKTEMESNVAPKTVIRRIFTEEPSESKKKDLECTEHPPSFAT
ncbi:replication protein A 70 kDa DNA-binding subunit [Artemisia annua]|uniref:Replication protein A 70 kDa DNA-binding subunit n=1 Tax=Artemisia annua TaxID=35608 RepID=A0A2U1L650_ARTAN|nr:replication protein A 70 kDa DNA-binding subunit [Artemisia annua]